MVGVWSKLDHKATLWLHLASWNFRDSQQSWKSKMECGKNCTIQAFFLLDLYGLSMSPRLHKIKVLNESSNSLAPNHPWPIILLISTQRILNSYPACQMRTRTNSLTKYFDKSGFCSLLRSNEKHKHKNALLAWVLRRLEFSTLGQWD